MGKRSLNQTLALRLAELMAKREISANQLGAKANMSPRTVGNYLKAEADNVTTKGRERSAKLAEVEALADVLGVNPLTLLMSREERAALATELVAELAAATPINVVEEGGETARTSPNKGIPDAPSEPDIDLPRPLPKPSDFKRRHTDHVAPRQEPAKRRQR